MVNRQIVAICVQEAGRLISGLLSLRSPKTKPISSYQPYIEPPAEPQEMIGESMPAGSKATSVEAGCVPCSLGHLGTCVGVLNEAMRFAKKDGIGSMEVIDRINICTDELNALERVDLRPEMIEALPGWEKDLANEALSTSRDVRHKLEGIKTVGDLEQAAANTQRVRQEIGRGWFKGRLARMPKEEKAKLAEKAIEKLGE